MKVNPEVERVDSFPSTIFHHIQLDVETRRLWIATDSETLAKVGQLPDETNVEIS